jgi:hypothetical protein
VTLHNSRDQQTHLFSKAHRAAEQVYVRGMLAAIQYMAKCLPLAPLPPTITAASAAPTSPLPLTAASAVADTFLDVARNPALRALIDELQQHSNGLAWRSFLSAVAAGIGAVEHWQRNQLLQLDEDEVDDGEDENFDDEADTFDGY